MSSSSSSSSSSCLKTLMPCLAVGFLFLFSFADAREFLFGGKNNMWTIPEFADEYNQWAERLRFKIGDSIVMKVDSSFDSILQVNEKDYNNCNKNNPIKTYKNGNSKIMFEDSGAFFFISGAEGHCERGQKLEVKVLSAKHGGGSSSGHHHDYAPAPSPSGSGHGLTVGLAGFALVFVSFVGLIMV